MRSCVFVFPFAVLCNKSLKASLSSKNPWYDWRFVAFMHANTIASQAAFARNCATSMAADLFVMMVHSHDLRDADAAKLTC
jgi:hypothetical protein